MGMGMVEGGDGGAEAQCTTGGGDGVPVTLREVIQTRARVLLECFAHW